MSEAHIGNVNAVKWTPEHDAMVRELRNIGYSGSQISAALNLEFKTAYSRNAVIGRMNRLGLCEKMVKAPKPEPRPRAPRIAAVKRPVHFGAPLHLSLIELEPDQCRWPYGDGPFTFCGCTVLTDSSYCPMHAERSVGRGTASERAAA